MTDCLYHYHVVYFGHNFAVGSIQMHRSEPMDTEEAIQDVAEYIRTVNKWKNKPVIVNIIPLRVEDEG